MNKALIELNAVKSVLPSDLMKRSLDVRVKRLFTDVDGVVIDKNTVPLTLQTKYPVYLLGAFDLRGGYRKAQEAVPAMGGTYYLTSFIFGVTPLYSIIGYTALSTIQKFLKVGDIVTVYTDNIIAPTYFVWIIASASTAALGSVILNLTTAQKDDIYNRLYVESVNYNTSNGNIEQWNEAITKISLNNVGEMKTDSFQPLIYRTPMTYLNNILILGLSFKCTQYFGIATYIQFATDELQLLFKLKL